MISSLATSLSLFFVALLFPSSVSSQSLWDKPVDFSTSNFWPSEPCVRSCLSGNQCAPCQGYPLSTWVGCTNNGCFCNNYATAYFFLIDCIRANCCVGCVSTDPYNLIYGYCVSTGDQVAAAAGGGGDARTTVGTMFTAPPSVTPTEKPVSNPYTTDATGAPPTPTSLASTPQATDTGLTRSDKISLGVGLGVGIPSVIAAIITIIQCRRG